ncbi:MAG: tetratricopeptide repeat protein [Saprospiraceae bacterium]
MRYFLILLPLLFLQCKSGNKNTSDLNAEITALEAEIGANPGSAQDKITGLLAKYEEFAASPENDQNQVVDYLLRAGEMASLINQPHKSLVYYEKILTEHAGHPKASTALFMKAYTLDDKLKKYDEAKVVYEDFLAKYPNDDFADDTQFLLDNLGKSEEEIIKLFEEKAAAQNVNQ